MRQRRSLTMWTRHAALVRVLLLFMPGVVLAQSVPAQNRPVAARDAHAVRTSPCASIAGNTGVLTPAGLVPIDSLRPSDTVRSRDPDSQDDITRRVRSVRRGPMLRPHVLDDEFDAQILSPGQLLWMQSRGWVEARSLEEQDIIATATGDVSVYEFNAVDDDVRQGVELEVEPPNNFFIGKAGLWARGAGDVSMCRSSVATGSARGADAGRGDSR